MVKFNRNVFHIKVCQEFIKFCFSACVYEEYVVNVSGIEDTVIVNFWAYMYIYMVRLLGCVGYVWKIANFRRG